MNVDLENHADFFDWNYCFSTKHSVTIQKFVVGTKLYYENILYYGVFMFGRERK